VIYFSVYFSSLKSRERDGINYIGALLFKKDFIHNPLGLL